MRFYILITLLPCALAAQTATAPAAQGNAFRRLPERLNSILAGAQFAQNESAAIVRHGGTRFMATLPGKCSIPLLRVGVPDGVIDPMPLAIGPEASIDPKFVLPAPRVCEERRP
jgi:hypothetical protein